jgi:hypothetical protein
VIWKRVAAGCLILTLGLLIFAGVVLYSTGTLAAGSVPLTPTLSERDCAALRRMTTDERKALAIRLSASQEQFDHDLKVCGIK